MAKFNLERRKKCQQNLEIIADLIEACAGVNRDVSAERRMLGEAQDLLKKQEYSEVENRISKMNEVLRHKTKITIIRKSVTALSRFRSYCDIAKKLGVLNEVNREKLESLVGERSLVFSLEDWEDLHTHCNEGISSVGKILENEYTRRFGEIIDAVRMGEDLDMDMMDVDILLELAQGELDGGEMLTCYDFLAQAMAVNKNVLQIFIKYASELRAARDKLDEFKGHDSKMDISQLEQLVTLSQETAKRGDYAGALDVATSLTNHIQKLNLSTSARERILNLRLRILDLKDICPDHFDKRKIFFDLDEAITRAKIEYNSEEYPNALDVLDSIKEEMEKVDRYVRREYCISLLNRCKNLMKDADHKVGMDSAKTVRIQEIMDYASELFNAERYGEACMKAEQCYEKIRSILKHDGRRSYDERRERIDELLGGLRLHKLDTPELTEMYERFKNYGKEGEFQKCGSLITGIEEKIHVRYRNFINKKLENIKDIVEMSPSLGDEVDDITSGLIIVQENFDNRNYERSLEILDRVAEKVEVRKAEVTTIRDALNKKLAKAGDTLAEMTRRGEDVEGLFKAMDKIERLIQTGDLVNARRVGDKLEAAIYGIIDNLFLNIDVLKGEIEELGVEGPGLFDNLVGGKRALAKEQFFIAYTIAMDIKAAIKELEKKLSEIPVGGEKARDDDPAAPPEPMVADEIPKEEALVPLGGVVGDGTVNPSEELLDISKEPAVLKAGKYKGTVEGEIPEKPDIVERAARAKELLDLLTERGQDISFLEREVELAMGYVERDNWSMADKHLQRCIEKAEGLVNEVEGIGVEELQSNIKDLYIEINRYELQGMVLKEARDELDRADAFVRGGNVRNANSSFTESKVRLDERVALYQKLVEEISQIQAKLSDLARDNIEVGIVHSLFNNIKNLTRNGEYEKALDVCEQYSDELKRRESYGKASEEVTPVEMPFGPVFGPSMFGDLPESAEPGLTCSGCNRMLEKPDNPFQTSIRCPSCYTENLF
jgi:LSD1 subclass zinc finger protein